MLQAAKSKTQSGREQDQESRARLLTLREAAAYLGVSYWTLRDWCLEGIIPVVRLPGSRLRAKGGQVVCLSSGHSMRKILVDRKDLDALIERSK